MTKLNFIISLCLIFSLTLSCKENIAKENNENNESVIIAGEFLNIQSVDSISNISIYVQDYVTKDITNIEKQLDTLGRFKFQFEITNQQSIMLIHNTIIDLIVKPGDSLFLKIDAQSNRRKEILESLEVSGTADQINKEVINFFINDPIDYEIFQYNRINLNPEEFKIYRDSIYLVQYQYSDSLLSKKSFSTPFKNWLEAQKLFALPNNYSFHEFYYNTESEMNDNNLSNTTKFNIKNIPQFLPKHRINAIASNRIPKKLLDYTLITSQKGASNLEPNDQHRFYLEKIIEMYSDRSELMKLIINDFTKSTLNRENLSFYETNKILIDSILFKSGFESSLKEKYEALKTRIDNPQLSNKINLKEYTSSNVDTLLQKIISESDGKPIYIDNWATWCQPCLSEFKDSTPKLMLEFDGEIEFVFLCYKSDKDQWKSTISKYNLEGQHYFIEKHQIEDLTKLFSINGFPTYTIINKDGDIIHTDNHFRPSNPKTTEILKNILNE